MPRDPGALGQFLETRPAAVDMMRVAQENGRGGGPIAPRRAWRGGRSRQSPSRRALVVRGATSLGTRACVPRFVRRRRPPPFESAGRFRGPATDGSPAATPAERNGRVPVGG